MLSLSPPRPFDLRLALFGHGFVDLAPHRWDADARRFHTVIPWRSGAVDVEVRQVRNKLAVSASSRAGAAAIERALVRMLRLDEDLAEFWSVCRAEPQLSWVHRRGAGRLMRSATLFEDLTKLLFTTNCSWAATRGMVSRLVQELGPKAPSGARAFPSAERVAEENERFHRDVVRAGYRAGHVVRLSRAFASGGLSERSFEDPALSTDEVRRRLLDLPGFGPYAAGQALRLLGRYDDLALDSWCRGRLAEMAGRKRPPSDRSVERRYARFGRYKGLALWMDLTAHWHGEAAR